jgi:hypothetical protein
MAAFGQLPDLQDNLRRVQPRNGFPVQNQGGMPRAAAPAPPKPFMTQPTVAPQPGPQALPKMASPTGNTGFTGGGALTSLKGALESAPPPPAQAPAPGAVPAPAVAPAGVSTAPSSASSSSTTGAISSAYTPLPAPAQDSLEQQIRGYLTNAFQGNTVSPEFIQRAKNEVFRGVSGQAGQAANRLRDSLIGRGMSDSGMLQEGLGQIESGRMSSFAKGIADVLNSAENQNIQGKQQAGSQGLSLLGGNRDWQMQWQNRQDQLQQQADAKAEAAAARAGANAPKTFQYVDPDTGQVYTMDESWF